MSPKTILRRLSSVLALAVGWASAYAQYPGQDLYKTTIVYVNTDPTRLQPPNPEINIATRESLHWMTENLNEASGQVDAGILYQRGMVDTLDQAVSYANSHPDEQVKIVAHGRYVDGEFKNEVTDTKGAIGTDDLPAGNNIAYYYCGMNGDGRTITTNDIGKSIGANEDVPYVPLPEDKNVKTDSSDSSELGKPADSNDDALGNDDEPYEGTGDQLTEDDYDYYNEDSGEL